MAKNLFSLTPAEETAGKKRAPAKADSWRQRAMIIGIALAVMWGLEIIDIVIGQKMNALGIQPRTVSGLIGIPLAPVLHGGIGHLISNTIPFAILGFLTIMRGTQTFVIVTTFVVLAGGLAVWLMGASAYHIGASGLIFGYFGYNLAMGLFERSLKSILVSVVVVVFYGTMIFGVLPGRLGVSWESHLFGFVAGGGWAYLVGRKKAAQKKKAKA